MANTHSLDLEASSSQYAYVADQAIFDGLSAFSIECWLKFESIADDMQPLTKWGATNATTAWRLITAGGKLRLVIGDGTTSGDVDANQTITLGVWHHFAFTWDGSLSVGSRAKAYVNSVDVTANDDTLATMNAGTAGFYVGNREGVPAAGFYDGKISDVRLWNDVRTPAEIAASYKTPLVGNEANLIGYWKLNNNYNDSTSNGNNLTASGSPVFSTDTPLDLTDGLVSYWKLDESSGNASDSVGSNTLTNNNTVPFVSGKINNGADFESTSSHSFSITDASQTGLDLSGSFSVSAWMKWESFPTTSSLIGKYKSSDNTRAYAVEFVNNTDISILISSDGSLITTKSVSWTPSTGTFYHITVVYDAPAGSATFYVNGSQQGTTQTGLPTSILNNANPFSLGAYNSGNFMDGIIDEVGVWNRALNADEVAMLYNSGSGLTYPFVTGYTITCSTGTFTLTGVATNFLRGYALVCSAGNFVLTGIDTLFKRGYGILCGVGTFIMTGFDTIFRHSGWTNRTKPSTTFTDRTKPTTTFTDRTKPTTNWTNR